MAREAAGDKDVGFMGAAATAGLQAGLVDELILHQVPGSSALADLSSTLPGQVRLCLVDAIPTPGITHLHYQVAR